MKFDAPHLIFLSCAVITVLSVVFLIGFIFINAAPIFAKEGVGFITSSTWDYGTRSYGISTFIIGTLALAAVTMVIACPLGILSAIYLAEWAPPSIERILTPLIELLVGIPSVVYGIFGFYILDWVFKWYLKPFVNHWLGWISFFQDNQPNSGLGIFLAATVLAVMVVPTIVALSKDAMSAVPDEYREASLSLGANKWETIKKVVIPAASPGILTSIVLGLMRATGETMAVVMLIGNSMRIPGSVFDTGYTMTSKILNDIGFYIMDAEPKAALFGIAAVLFIIEMLMVGSVRVLSRHYSHK